MGYIKSVKKSVNHACGTIRPRAAGPAMAVMGVGNLLLSDEGVGIHVLNRLQGRLKPQRVQLIDAGTMPDVFSLINPSVTKLIIIDAADGGGRPGSIYRIDAEAVTCASCAPVSLHDIGLAESLAIMRQLNPALRISIIGVQPYSLELGLELTPEVKQRIPELVELIIKEIRQRDKFAEVNR